MPTRRRCWRRCARRRNLMPDGARPHREVAPIEVMFNLAAKVRGRTLEPPLHTPTETLPRFPYATHMSEWRANTRAGPRPTPHHALTDHFACALPCGQGLLRVDLRLLGLRAYRRAPGWRGRKTLNWLALELYQDGCAKKKSGMLSVARRVRWVSVHACAMYAASRARSDAVPARFRDRSAMDVRVLYSVEGNVGPNVMEPGDLFISGRNGDSGGKKEGSQCRDEDASHLGPYGTKGGNKPLTPKQGVTSGALPNMPRCDHEIRPTGSQ